MTIDTNVYRLSASPTCQIQLFVTYQGANEHLQEHQDLLHRTQGREIHRSEPIDCHAAKAEKQTIDIRDLVFGIDPIHDSRQDKGNLASSATFHIPLGPL
jgi:hypothetical protein